MAEASFKKCKDRNNPLCSEAGGWCEWPKGANEDKVLKRFAKLVNTLVKICTGSQMDHDKLDESC